MHVETPMRNSGRIFVQHLLQLAASPLQATDLLFFSVERFRQVFLDLLLVEHEVLRFGQVFF